MRFIDETALRTVLSICERPQMFGSGSDAIAIAFVEGYLLDKSVYRLVERLHLELDLPSNVAVFPAIRRMFENRELQNPLNFLKVTIEHLLRGEEYWHHIMKSVDKRDTIGDRYRAARDMHELATKEALADLTCIPTRVREAFVPVHQSCREKCTTMA